MFVYSYAAVADSKISQCSVRRLDMSSCVGLSESVCSRYALDCCRGNVELCTLYYIAYPVLKSKVEELSGEKDDAISG